jgi:hypothetical protein
MKDYDWDVIAEGLLWVHEVFPTFKRARMHGGSPLKKEIYGYTGWLKERGYVSIHNPSDESRNYSFTLDRKFGLTPGSRKSSYILTSPIASSVTGLKNQYRYGDTITGSMKPREIRILNFDMVKHDWSTLTSLQTRTNADFEALKPAAITGHAILGIWKYGENTREFKADGTCALRTGDDVQWTKRFTLRSAKEVIVKGNYEHRIQDDGTLKIEGKYTATKQ